MSDSKLPNVWLYGGQKDKLRVFRYAEVSVEKQAVDWWNKRAPVKRECPCGEEMDEKGCPNGH